MMLFAPRALMLAVAACAAASGCAQWQPGQGPNSLATALDDHALALDDQLIARCARVLGDGSPAPAAIRQPVATPRTVVLASLEAPLEQELAEPPMPPAEGDAAEPLPRPIAPTPAAAPALVSVERTAEPTAVETPAARKPAATAPELVAATSACDECCCCDGVDCPVAANCPIHGTCGWCTGCLMGGRCRQLFTRPEPGPPPIRYRPPMPPKFLPVPTQPILAPARPDAPEPWRGNIEVGWGPQLTFPARD